MKGEFCGGSLSCPYVAQWPNKFPDIYIYAHCGYFDAITESYADGRHGAWSVPIDSSNYSGFGNLSPYSSINANSIRLNHRVLS